MRKREHLVKAEKKELGPVMREYCDLFLYDRSVSVPCPEKYFHEIKMRDALPIHKNPYKVPFALKEDLKRQLDVMMQRGIITPSCSEWAATVIFVKKTSVDSTPKYRFCTDFHGLNEVTKTPVYPTSDIKVNLPLMAVIKYLKLQDMESAYWHIPVNPDYKNKTGSVTPFGRFSFQSLAYGLTGAPSSFQKIMDVILMGL
jgi:hypothetical protein